MLKCLSVLNTFVAYWLVSLTSITEGCNRFRREGRILIRYMFHVVDLLLRNHGGRERRPNCTIFVVAVPQMQKVGWWWVRVESLV